MDRTKKKSLKNSLMLMLAALVWGIAFVAQSEGMNYVGNFTFNACRFLLGGIVLIPCIYFLHGRKDSSWQTLSDEEQKKQVRMGIIGGICCGCVLAAASSLQQYGIAQTSVGKAGFITTLYIIIVPFMGLFLKKKIGLNVWISALIAAAGMYFLCITESFSIAAGDRFIMIAAVGFSVHILVIDHFSPKADGVVISCVQFFTASILTGAAMFLFEHPQLSDIFQAAVPILYAGIMSCGVGYTLQVVAQNGVDPTVASLLLSLESVFSVLAGWVILGQVLSGRELFGCALVFAAVILVQIPMKQK